MPIRVLVICLLLSSCATRSKSYLAGALIGSALGGLGGAVFSPNDISRPQNAYLFGVIGAGAGALIAGVLHDDPLKTKAPLMVDAPKEKEIDLPLFDFSPELKELRPEVNFKPVKKYEVPMEKLPKELEGKAKKQFVIEYEAEARTIELGNRTIQISPFKAWENTYEP